MNDLATELSMMFEQEEAPADDVAPITVELSDRDALSTLSQHAVNNCSDERDQYLSYPLSTRNLLTSARLYSFQSTFSCLYLSNRSMPNFEESRFNLAMARR